MTDICDVYKLWKSLEVFLESQAKQNSRPSTLFIPDTFLINPFPEECENEFVLFITSLFFCFVFLESLFSTFPGIINRVVNWLIDQFNVQCSILVQRPDLATQDLWSPQRNSYFHPLYSEWSDRM